MQRKQLLVYCKKYFNSLTNQGSLSKLHCLNRNNNEFKIGCRFLSSEVANKGHTDLKISSWPHPLSLNHVWLRDHCRCKECYNFNTNQRIIDILSVPSDIHPEEFYIEEEFLVVIWPDRHCSKYPLNWLWESSYDGHLQKIQRKPILWEKKDTSSVTFVDMADYMKSEEGLKAVVKSIVEYGVGVVKNVPATIAATRDVVVRMAPVQTTLFGEMWEFSDRMSHSDTAYTRQALGAHTDHTYFSEASGVQVFHCLHHDGAGGENLLVDGFRAARDLQEKHIESYNLLTSTAVEAHYLEPEQHYTCTAPILKLNPVNLCLEQVRFNLYDRAPMSLPSKKIAKFYEALRSFTMEVRRPDGEWWIKLRPGIVILFDNWRVLHGRAAYTGNRTMGGCYVSRSDFLSRARVLGLL